MPFVPTSFQPALLLTYLGFALALGAAFYVYVAIALMIIARKTGTPNGWLAWVPIANLYLMCRVARRPAWWLLLFLIPLVNLVILVIVWAGIAKARGRPAWVGILAVVPIVNLIVPAYLAAGDGASPGISTPDSQVSHGHAELVCPKCGAHAAAEETFCGECGASISSAGAEGPSRTQTRSCSKCGASISADETFCGECGAPLAAATIGQSDTTRGVPTKRPVITGAAIAGLFLALLAGAARMALNSGLLSSLLNRAKPGQVSAPATAGSPSTAPAGKATGNSGPAPTMPSIAPNTGIAGSVQNTQLSSSNVTEGRAAGNPGWTPTAPSGSRRAGAPAALTQNLNGTSIGIPLQDIPQQTPVQIPSQQPGANAPSVVTVTRGRDMPSEPLPMPGSLLPAGPMRNAQAPATISVGGPAASVPTHEPIPLVPGNLKGRPPESAQPPPYSGPLSGTVSWTGLLEKDGTLAIDGSTTSIGSISGGLPGVPIVVEINAKEFAFAELPAPSNGWRRLVIRSKRRWQGTLTMKWTVAQ